MKSNKLCFSVIDGEIRDLSAFEYKRKPTIEHSVFTVFFFLALIFAVSSSNAAQLWNNGDTDGNTLGWGQSTSSLDDFYVPGGGWFINRAETIGIFVDPATVSEVEVAIWPHDIEENEPDGDSVKSVKVTDFEATPTGRTILDREEIKITVDFDKTYLKGQRYYWIEFTVHDQYGIKDFRFLARQGVSHEPSWTHFSRGSISSSLDLYGSELDLSYALYGNRVTVSHGGPDDMTIGISDISPVISVAKELTIQLPEKVGKSKLPPPEVVLNLDNIGYWLPCPKGNFRSPFKMPIYDENGIFVVGYKTVWFCIPNNLEPEG